MRSTREPVPGTGPSTGPGAGRRRRRPRRTPFGSWLLGPEGQSPRRLRARVQVLLTVALTLTHGVGAAVVLLLSVFVVTAPAPDGPTWLALAVAVPVYVGVALVVGTVWGTRVALQGLRWAAEGGGSSRRVRRRMLRVPLRLTVLAGVLWAAADVLFVGLALWLQPQRALSTAFTVAIGGVVACAVAYLFSEFALRPVTARALDDGGGHAASERPRGLGVGGRMLMFWLLGTAAPVVGLVVAALLVLVGDDVSTRRLAVEVLVLGGVVLVVGLLVTVLNARSVVAPLTAVRGALLEVERGDLDQRVAVYDATEIGELQAGFNHMVAGLREREHLRDVFGRHVGREVARAAVDGDVELGGEVREVTVLFVDLVGSTTMAAERDPAEVVAVLNAFFEVVVDEVDRAGGIVNKFMGDAVLAVFGAPVEQPDHARAGLLAARRIDERLRAERPDVAAGVGVCTGATVAGNVGTRARLEYTVIGDAVNAAARLTELAKAEEPRVLTTLATVRAAARAGGDDEARCWREAGSTVLRGRPSATDLARPV
ncbi:adenylate cyclase [Nocardioides marinisabuli]|uniref:Adenylate cyclase n=1 Tax=Nocardioides marinisabuli TaxID=419476 RepID=A0A7Y9F0Q0_9ACTN|nr:adenylate/guanylate cyclase domain-containing protein [Nocardioides marinisabuli]NYD57452.1 adenylate cyclase [Nocardioides marinisabuli]